MCVCVCICMYICVCVCVFVSMYIYIYVCIYIHLYICVCEYTHGLTRDAWSSVTQVRKMAEPDCVDIMVIPIYRYRYRCRDMCMYVHIHIPRLALCFRRFARWPNQTASTSWWLAPIYRYRCIDMCMYISPVSCAITPPKLELLFSSQVRKMAEPDCVDIMVAGPSSHLVMPDPYVYIYIDMCL